MHYFRYSDILIKFCQEFSYKERVGKSINLFIIFQNGYRNCRISPKKKGWLG